MCGIVGYAGKKSARSFLVDGLKRLKYRGYDSAGIAVVNGKVTIIKRAGTITELEKAVTKARPSGSIGIGHTRWATHGPATELNAHPHRSGPIVVVHNGIIENYLAIKARLVKAGFEFVSDTDTEAVAHLIAFHRQTTPTLEDAVLATVPELEGTFGLLVLDETEPDKMVGASRESPLIVGYSPNGTYLASSEAALLGYAGERTIVEPDTVVICHSDHTVRFVGFDGEAKEHQRQRLEGNREDIEKSGFAHFTLKEIFEQPDTVVNVTRGRLTRQDGISHLGGLNLQRNELAALQQIVTIGCGTAHYAGSLGAMYLERLARVQVRNEVASEYRYANSVLLPHTLGIAISQSGETMDTLVCLRQLKDRNATVMGIVNVVGSAIAREAGQGTYLHAGPEIGVASTKAFTAQVIAQLLLALHLGRARGLDVLEAEKIVQALQVLPQQIRQLLEQAPQIEQLAKQLAHFDHAMYLGRDLLYPVALEGALKLKEISYVQAEAYPAGEVKHGPLALVDDNLLVVFLNPRNRLYDKSRSNLEVVKARQGHVLAVGTVGDESITQYAEHVLWIPECNEWTQPILVNVLLQMFAYYMAVEKGSDVDQPRNLAKSVTVE